MKHRLVRPVVFALVSAAVVLTSSTPSLMAPAAHADEAPYHRIHFPVQEAVSFTDDWHAPRPGGRVHLGNDLMGHKLDHELAAVDGTVSWVKVGDTAGISGNMLALTGTDGWFYYYIHINNDTPGTDDGLNPPEFRFAPGIGPGSKVKAGDFIAYMGDSGDAEDTGPHLHFEVHQPDGTPIDPWTSLRLAQGLPAGTRCSYGTNPDPKPSAASGAGYWLLGSDGGVFTFGGAQFFGSTGGMKLNKPVTGMAATPSGKGYWLVASDGGIFAYGDAGFYGSTGSIALNQPITGMASTPTGKGYWLVASDGGIFAFGDAEFFGSTGAIHLNKPITGLATTSTGKGYWMVASDGGMFAFGDAEFQGSTASMSLPSPIVGMAPAKAGKGYWLLGGDGAIYAFGGATFAGSLPGLGLCTWPAAKRIVPTATGDGYWVAGTDGSAFAFGDARFLGSVTSLHIAGAAPLVAMAVAPK